jgi:hypothetical protein
MFTKQAELPEGVERLQIKDLIFNKSPMFIPNVYKLEPKTVERRVQESMAGYIPEVCNIGSKGFILRSTVLFSLRLKA